MNLTESQKTELRRRIEVETHYLNGGKIEQWIKGNTRRGWSQFCASFWYPNWEDYDYRIKPEPKLRLRRPDELPPVFWITCDVFTRGKSRLCIGFDELDRPLYYSISNFQVCPLIVQSDNAKWSPDRLTWHSFMVEDKG